MWCVCDRQVEGVLVTGRHTSLRSSQTSFSLSRLLCGMLKNISTLLVCVLTVHHWHQFHFGFQLLFSVTYHQPSHYYSAPEGEQSIAISLSVCVVCPRARLRNCWTNLHEILYADPPWPWLNSPLATLCYVMYFQFYG